MSADILLVETTTRRVSSWQRTCAVMDTPSRLATDGSDALRQWEAQRPDIVLLDLGLPDMDGESLIRRIRREATTPILILSARDQESRQGEGARPWSR